MLELGLHFPDPATVVVNLNEDGEIEMAASQPFAGPLDPAAQKELHWYLEVYPAQYMTEVDDDRAKRIAAQLPGWGSALFDAVFAARDAERLLNRFQDHAKPGRLLTVNATHPSVLAQPWELLKDPRGTYLFLEEPRISVRRRLPGAGAGRKPYRFRAKATLHLLFVVSRPSDELFIDPRADPMAVMDSLDERAPGRVTVEFLCPATFDGLVKRLESDDKPAVDILHFDGHGAYDAEGRMTDAAKQAMISAGYAHLLRDAGETSAAQQGFLLFEKENGEFDLVPAALLGEMLNRKRIGLVVLSACRSAMVGGEDAMGSVAARLTDSGLPAVLAMTHSVLVQTTRALFDAFYEELACNRPVGTSLDNARRALYADPERGKRRRGDGFITLKLQDWFLPALYQAGRDTTLLKKLKKGAAPVTTPAPAQGLPELQKSGFLGRRCELWDIERWFVGGIRRLVVHGFGGEGKTYVAAEAGRWFVRTGLFRRVCFVDYERFQGIDARGWAVSRLGTVLGQNLLDAEAATAALQATPTLLILDNLEAVPAAAAAELLTAAKVWSEAGESRVLVTTRQLDLEHPDWPAQGSNGCRYLEVKGLQPDDALDWFQKLMALPPKPAVTLSDPEALTTLFGQIDFHPLSIGVLAEVLKTCRIAEVGERLEAILKTETNPLVASLNLSIERLAPELREQLPKLGVFQGGATEYGVIEVTQLSAKQWATLRLGLEQAGLIRAEAPGSPYSHFHPTLAPALWVRLGAEERAALTARHHKAYHALSLFLYDKDKKNPAAARAMARDELPNLMAAVRGALDAAAPEAASFAEAVGHFLEAFGLARDQAALAERAQAAAGETGSRAWYLARFQLGQQLFSAGRFAEAERVFAGALGTLGDTPSYDRGQILGLLARCHRYQGRAAEAEAVERRALAEVEALERTPDVRLLICTLRAEIGNSLLAQGHLDEARAANKASLDIAWELGNDRAAAVNLAQLGKIALNANDLGEAEALYREALTTFQALGEPVAVATAWHQLGIIYQQQRRWEDAEQAYRESARLHEERADLRAAGMSWHELASLMSFQDKLEEAEQWYLKDLAACRDVDDRAGQATTLHSLADLLRRRPSRLADARAYADQALAIKRALDPTAGEIWKTYGVLAEIAAAQDRADEARAFRRQERQSFAAAPSSREIRRGFAWFVSAVAAAAADPARRPALDLDGMIGRGWGQLVAAVRRLLDGERDEDTLCAGLDRKDSLVIAAALRALADPAVLAGLRADAPSDARGRKR